MSDNQSSGSRSGSIWNTLCCFCKKDEGEDGGNEDFARVPRARGVPNLIREAEKVAKAQQANERRWMFVGPNLPFLMCLRRRQENIEMQNVAGTSNKELEPQDNMIRVAGPSINDSGCYGRSVTLHRDSVKLATQTRRKRKLASRRSRNFYVPQNSAEPPEIYDISVTYSPSDDEN